MLYEALAGLSLPTCPPHLYHTTPNISATLAFCFPNSSLLVCQQFFAISCSLPTPLKVSSLPFARSHSQSGIWKTSLSYHSVLLFPILLKKLILLTCWLLVYLSVLKYKVHEDKGCVIFSVVPLRPRAELTFVEWIKERMNLSVFFFFCLPLTPFASFWFLFSVSVFLCTSVSGIFLPLCKISLCLLIPPILPKWCFPSGCPQPDFLSA